MTAFDIAMKTLFADPNLREVAEYVSQLGKSKQVSVIIHRGAATPDVFSHGSFVSAPTLMLDVRMADCPDVGPGDRFVVNGSNGRVTYTVQGQPKRDGLVWRVDLVEQCA